MSASWPPDVDLLEVIDGWIRSRRWFPADPCTDMELIANIDVSPQSAPLDWDHESALDPVWISLIRLSGVGAILQVPLVYTDRMPADGVGVIDRVRDAWLVDGALHPAFLRSWTRLAAERGTLGEGLVDPAELESGILAQADRARPLDTEQSNTSILLVGPHPRAILKSFRTIMAGVHPDLEIPLALVRAGWEHVPSPLGHLELRLPGSASSEMAVSGITSALVEGAEDGFDIFVALAREAADPSGPARELGRITGELHHHLADLFGLGSPSSGEDLRARIASNLHAAAAEVREIPDDLLARLEEAIAPLGGIDLLPPTMRIHGDYHLGQTLRGGDGRWYVVDFEGEPLRPLEERRRGDLALRDIAGMLRSFDYAAGQAAHSDTHAKAVSVHSGPSAAITAELPVPTDDTRPTVPPDRTWARAAEAAFVDGYTEGHGFDRDAGIIVRALMIEKAAYEVVYEHRLRPSWLSIPLTALKDLAQARDTW